MSNLLLPLLELFFLIAGALIAALLIAMLVALLIPLIRGIAAMIWEEEN